MSVRPQLLADQSLLPWHPQMSLRFNTAGAERMKTISFHFQTTQPLLLVDRQLIKIKVQGLADVVSVSIVS